MITEQEKELIKQVIGKRSLSAIHQFFIDNNIVRKNGDPYSKSHISNVLNGGISHDDIEDGIAMAALHYHTLAERKANAKEKLMQQLKKEEGE
ncbi:hypothetical protein POV27_17855 [Aureisphaera galaxeae]|uniref:hypothetical protein n=1 Tax=Aureisphaera galaxeae TaxID=1538023 RepID=UPI0023504EBE|nr:hypothetical protein [Aureisphaera galaxeae]MDC8005923.1 hypothetical protein [Aureisphaera galaxeae]